MRWPSETDVQALTMASNNGHGPTYPELTNRANTSSMPNSGQNINLPTRPAPYGHFTPRQTPLPTFATRLVHRNIGETFEGSVTKGCRWKAQSTPGICSWLATRHRGPQGTSQSTVLNQQYYECVGKVKMDQSELLEKQALADKHEAEEPEEAARRLVGRF